MEKYTVGSLAHFTLAARLQQLSVVAYCFSFQTAFSGHRLYTCVLLDTECTAVYCWTQTVHLCTAGHRVYSCVLLDTQECTPVYCWTQTVHLCTAGHKTYIKYSVAVYCWTQSVHLCTAGHRVYTSVLLDTGVHLCTV